MNTQKEQILDEEYKEALEDLQRSPDLFTDEAYENERSNWIMKRVREGLQKLI